MIRSNPDDQIAAVFSCQESFRQKKKTLPNLKENKLFQELIDNIPDAVYFKDKMAV